MTLNDIFFHVIFHLFTILISSALLNRETLSPVKKVLKTKDVKFHKPNVFQYISFVLTDNADMDSPLLFHPKNPIACKPIDFDFFIEREQVISKLLKLACICYFSCQLFKDILLIYITKFTHLRYTIH